MSFSFPSGKILDKHSFFYNKATIKKGVSLEASKQNILSNIELKIKIAFFFTFPPLFAIY